MDSGGHDRDIDGHCSVAEDAFWHSNMDLYYGYDTNELVEVEHEPYKYWLARIVYNYKQLLLLRWECDYGEFWLDTSANSRRRCYPPGYYLQPQLKSQYEFRRPPKPPTRKDPYANIKNVEDLLLAEEPIDQSDAAKCKNIPFKPEDAEELEAALQTLNELNCDSLIMDCDEKTNGDDQTIVKDNVKNNSKAQLVQDSFSHDSLILDDCGSNNGNKCTTENRSSPHPNVQEEEDEAEKETRLDEEKLHVCKTIRHKAIEEYKSKIASKLLIPKPKQFYDLGGINPERLFVPGAILEICHYKHSITHTRQEEASTAEQHTLCHWFAIVTENIGGRLTLRWLLSDDPKFKQGRLELKSVTCSFVEEETNNQSSNLMISSISGEADQVKKIPVKEVSFRLHYCHPSISTIGQGQALGRSYLLPDQVENSMLSTLEQPHFSYLLQLVDTQDVPTALGELVKVKSKRLVEQIKKRLYDSVFDTRRINLDKDRPLIDYILHIVRKRCPNYLDTSTFQKTNQEVLVSTPKTTKISRGIIKYIFEPGVFLIETQTRGAKFDGRVIFVYPYDSSYTVLPLSWGDRYKDCLSTSNSCKSIVSSEEHSKDIESGVSQSDASPIDSQTQVSDIDNSKDSGTSSLVASKDEARHARSASPLMSITSDNETKSDTIKKDSELFEIHHHDNIDTLKMDDISVGIIDKFKISNQLEVVHPSSDTKICSGRIRRISPPLLWIQISNDSYTVVPFNSTDIYPLRWCESHNHPLIYMLPIDVGSFSKHNRKNDAVKDTETIERWDDQNIADNDFNDAFNIDKISDKQDDINDLITESAWCTRIFFNHKCFSGPALSKGKICSLPQYVGPGPVRLVMEEVVTKVISVAYVPPRILNDLSSKNFEDLLVSRNIINTSPLTFKAKYQKRVYREELPVIINAEDVEAFCECICEHLKCCYNLFGPNLYDGDDCPGHCRGLTKSNKFMKRAIYYREKARLGEFVSDANKKGSTKNGDASKGRQNYGGRASQDSTGSRCKTPKMVEANETRVSDPPDSNSTNEQKDEIVTDRDLKSSQEILQTPLLISDESEEAEPTFEDPNIELSPSSSSDRENHILPEIGEESNTHKNKQDENSSPQIVANENGLKRKSGSTELDDYLDNEEVDSSMKLNDCVSKSERIKRHSPDMEQIDDTDENLNSLDGYDISKNNIEIGLDLDGINRNFYSDVFKWSIEDVYKFVKDSKYSQFATHLRDQEIDGPAFLLLDMTTLKEHFISPPYSSHSSKEICGLSEFIKDLGEKVLQFRKLKIK